jgi:MFS family permease
MNTKGLLYFPWVIPAFFLIIVFLFVFRKFIFALPNKTKVQFILAGTVYVLGALGMELIGGYIADKYGYTTIYGLASTIEELLEMSGVVIFINALLNYLQSQASELNFALSFQPSSRKKFS